MTVSALIAMNRPDQLRSHMALARQNGITQDELIETVTHLAFYAGWPSAVSAATMAKGNYSAPFRACRVTLAKVGLRCDALEGANKGFKYIGPLLMHRGRVGAKYAVVLRSLQGPKAA